MTDLQKRADDLFSLIYAHTVIKYDPEAGKRCIIAAFERDLTAPSGEGDVGAHIAKLREMAEDMRYDIMPSVRAVMICAADLLASTATKLAEVERARGRLKAQFIRYFHEAADAQESLAQAVGALEEIKGFSPENGMTRQRMKRIAASALDTIKGTPDAE